MTKSVLSTLIVCLLATTAGTASAASVMNSPAIPGNVYNNNDYICGVVNTGTKDAEVTVDIVDTVSGLVLASSGLTTLAPQKRTGVSLSGVSTPTVATYCRATGLSSKKGTLTYHVRDALERALFWVTVP